MTLFSNKDFRAVWDVMKPDIITTRLFFDPLAVPLTILFAKAGVSANLVTFSALLPGLVGAWFFAAGKFGLGALGYYIFFLLDTVDGKLARLSGSKDPLGAFYDFVVDRIVIGLMLLGMSFSFTREDLSVEFLATQLFLVSFFLKDVFDLKLRESGVDKVPVQSEKVTTSSFFDCYKIHFKPGQLLSCFIIFIVAPVSQVYLPCILFALACVLFSIGHNVLLPWVAYFQIRR